MKLRPPLERPSSTEPPVGALPDMLVVKFVEGSRVRRGADGLFFAEGPFSTDDDARLERAGLARGDLEAALAGVNEIFGGHPGTSVEGLVPAGKEWLLEEGRVEAEQRWDQELADLNLYFAVRVVGGQAAVSSLVEELNTFAVVESAYVPVQTSPAAGDEDPLTTFVSTGQTWLGRAPNGIDAEYAWRFPGGDGAGVRVVDVEFSWELFHEDLPGSYFLTEQSAFGGFNVDHGTAVLGQLCAVHNDYGARGIVPGAAIGVSSWGRWGLWAAGVVAASLALERGDVMLLEMHLPGPGSSPGDVLAGSGPGFLPVEVDGATRDAIIFSVLQRGIVVVEAAGNGSVHLDRHVTVGFLFRDRAIDSGAIMVGAGEAGRRVALDFSNHGSRLDVHGWGEGVHTTGYGDAFQPLDRSPRQRYTSGFGGTSSASPMVAGAAAIIQGVLRAAGREPLHPLAMRELLVRTGSQQESGDAEARRIGPMPDLHRALASLGFESRWLHVFAVPATGRVLTNSLRETDPEWTLWRPSANAVVTGGSAVGAVSRSQERLDVFAVGLDGRVFASRWRVGGAWEAWRPVGSTLFPPGAPVAAVSRRPSHLDLFAIAADGRPYTTWWHEGGQWATWRRIAGGQFPAGAPLSAISRSPNHLDVFAVGLDGREDGRLYTSTWNSRQADWAAWTDLGPGIFKHRTPVSTVSWRADQVDVIAVGRDGRVYTCSRMDGQPQFSAWRPLGDETFPELTTIPALARGTDGIDLFGINRHGHMVTTRWTNVTNEWSPWRRIRGGVFQPTGAPTAVSSGLNRLDLFALGLDGRIYTSSWAGTAEDWSNWKPLHTQTFPESTAITATYR